ncbi:class I SAM-dependent DNA methyltransferase [Synechococcus sp. MIT S9451]|uniref:class I SAM-dependent DNA methyltransferase n=1 Tax=Synechococcus sp. MIT S9451 TaxID=3082543 RepID=UPI0039B45165
MSNPFHFSSKFYDLLYSDKDTIAESNYVHQHLQQNKISGNTILEFGCGTGRHARQLASLGYKVHGIDRSKAMVESCPLVSGFTCQYGDIVDFTTNKNFDAILSLFHVISYQVTNDDLLSSFNTVYNHLNNGGLFLFDVWYTPAVLCQQPETRIKRIQTSDIAFTRIAEPTVYPNLNRVDVNYTMFCENLHTHEISTFTEVHPMRHFSIPEIQYIATNFGFEIIQTEEWLTRNVPSFDTWGITFLLRKK